LAVEKQEEYLREAQNVNHDRNVSQLHPVVMIIEDRTIYARRNGGKDKDQQEVEAKKS
jgi:hypothetical protein